MPWRVLLLGVVLLAACRDGDAPRQAVAEIVRTLCQGQPGDSLPGVAGGVDYTRSHLVGSPRYGVLTARDKADGTPVTIDYMVHEPQDAARALVVLIAGGSLNAAIRDNLGNDAVPDSSGGNFLVRSAHRFAAAGFRAITLDRPSDYSDIFDGSSSSYDAYRNSMLHAVDIAAVVDNENGDRLPVVLVGTSRGAVSAFANNSLAAGIALSSPLTSGELMPLGGAALPFEVAVRDTLVLFHAGDACPVTAPEDAAALTFELFERGLAVTADEVMGGFAVGDACQAFHHHGFTGIEGCTVGRHARWIDALVGRATRAGNRAPLAADIDIVLAGPEAQLIGIVVDDPDGDAVTLALPYITSVFGGGLELTGQGVIAYTSPPGRLHGTDRFVYTVADPRGGVDFGRVTVSPGR